MLKEDSQNPNMNDNNSNQAGRWRCDDHAEYKSAPGMDQGNPLSNIYKRMKEFDEDMGDTLRGQFKILLLFATLFSAAVTIFTVDSYKWLREDQTEKSAKLLAQISLQLSAITNNSTSPVPSAIEQTPFTPDPRSVRINICWIMALIMSLSTLVFGIPLLQWLHEFKRDRLLPPEDAIPIRQLRHDGFVSWGVPLLATSLPVILQLSVLFFVVGLLDLLWSLHPVVAAVNTALAGLVALAVSYTVVAPFIQLVRDKGNLISCPYKSSISLLVVSFADFAKQSLSQWLKQGKSLRSVQWALCGPIFTSWAEIETRYQRNYHHRYCGAIWAGEKAYNIFGFVRALEWMMDTMQPHLNHQVALDIFHSLHSALPKGASREIMRRWATRLKGIEGRGEVEAALGLDVVGQRDEGDDLHGRIQYELLMVGFLRKCASAAGWNNWGWERRLALELQIRCLNTIGDKRRIPNKVPFPPLEASYNEEIYQVLATTLDYINTHIDEYPTHVFDDHHYSIGQALDYFIRYIPPDEENVFKCAEILRLLKLLLNSIHQRSGDEGWVRSVGYLLRAVDVQKMEKWEEDIHNTSDDTAVPMIAELMPFIKEVLAVNQN